MQLRNWAPLMDLEREMRAMFDRYWPEGDDSAFRVVTDMQRADDALLMTFELPGVDPDKDIEVTLDDDVLVVTGTKTQESEVDEEDRYLRERRFGRFQRRIPLPDNTDVEHIEAGYDRGVLLVKIPLMEPPETTVKSIPVTTSE